MNRTSPQTQLAVLMFCDIEGSVLLKQKAGSLAYGQALARHDALFKKIIKSTPDSSIIKDTGDGFLARFASVGDAINAALQFQFGLARTCAEKCPIKSRIGIHIGQVAELADEDGGQPKIVGLSADIASRIMGLACGGQILLTRAAFDDGRQFVREHPPVDETTPPPIKWVAHGQYLFKGMEEPIEVFEVGSEGLAEFSVPRESPNAKRCVAADEEPTLGWRPAIGADIPGRGGWKLQRRLGEGGFGEVWLGASKFGERRVFKFCFDPARLRSLKREIVLFRLLRNALGDRPDIARLHEVKLDEPPFLLESEYTEGGNLGEWAQRQGGIGAVPLSTRLDIVAAIAEAVSAAHSVGVLHKDIKPSNILIDTRDGGPRPRLADFGIGMLADPQSLKNAKITITSFPQMTEEGSSHAGTMMYAPPELVEGKPYTIQGDIYSLGVILYQMVIGNLERSLAQGWERNVPDSLLREDIAACVDGEPSRRLPAALDLAARLRLLPQRRAMLAEQDRARAQAEEARQREAEAQRREELATLAEARTKSVLAQVYVRDGMMWFDQGDLSLGLLFFVHALAIESPQSPAAHHHRVRIKSVMSGLAPPQVHTDQHPQDPAILKVDGRELRLSGYEAAIFATGAEDKPVAVIRHAPPGFGIAGSSWINHATFSPDGKRVATASNDHTAQLWDAATGMALTPALLHGGSVEFAAFSHDGNRLITGSSDCTARIWDTTSGIPLCEPIHMARAIFDAIFDSDGGRVATVSLGDCIRLWDSSNALSIPENFPHSGPRVGAVYKLKPLTPPLWSPKGIRYAVFEGDGQRITARYDRKISVSRNVSPLQQFCLRLSHRASVHHAVYDSAGQRILTASDDGTAALWDAQSGRQISLFRHAAPVRMATFGDKDQTVLTASMDDTARLWDAPSGKQFGSPLKHSDGVQRAIFSPDRRLILTTALDDTARLWTAEGELIARLQWPTPAGDLLDGGSIGVFSPDGAYITTASTDRTVCIWESEGRFIDCFMYLHHARINSITFSPNGRWLLTAGDDKVAHVFNPKTGKMVSTLTHAAPVVEAVFSPDGALVVTASVDQTARIWDAEWGTPRSAPMRHEAKVNFATISPDGTQVLTASEDETARLWDCSSGRPLTLPLRHPAAVQHASFHPRGGRIITACADGGAYEFDITPDDRPVDMLLRQAEVLAAHRLDETGTLVPLRLEEWLQRANSEPT